MILPVRGLSLVVPAIRLDFLGEELLTIDCILGLRATAIGDVGSISGWSPLFQTVVAAVGGEARVWWTSRGDDITGSTVFLGGEDGSAVSREMGGILLFDFLFSPLGRGIAGGARDSFRVAVGWMGDLIVGGAVFNSAAA
jgi:hypothetical protein